MTTPTHRPTPLLARTPRQRPLFDPPIVGARSRRVRQARPAPHGAEPGDVRRARRQRATRRVVLVRDIVAGRGDIGFTLQLALWLWFTVLFANFAEAMAEGRGKAQADTLRKSRTQTHGQAARARHRRPIDARVRDRAGAAAARAATSCSALPGDVIPGDGEVVEGVASVDESRSPASPRRSSASAAATARRSPAARRCCPTTRRPHHRQPRRDVPRPHDRARRGRDAAEDAERDRAHDPAVRPDDHLPVRRRHAAAVRHLQRRARRRCRC